MKKILIIFGVIFSFCMNVNAASICSYQEQNEINQKAANVRVSYEIAEEKVTFVEGEGVIEVFKINILNISDDFYVIIKNDINNEEKRFDASDSVDGIISFTWDYADTVTNFIIEVYTTNKTSCPGELYKTVYLTTPRYNEYYNTAICQELIDFYLCQKFVTIAEFSEDKFFDQVESYQNGNVNDEGENIENNKSTPLSDIIFNFINEYKLVIIGVIVIAIGGIVVIKVIKGKKQRDLRL